MTPEAFEELERLRAMGVAEYETTIGPTSGFRVRFFEPVTGQSSRKPDDEPPDNSMPTRAELAELRRRIEMPPEGSG